MGGDVDAIWASLKAKSDVFVTRCAAKPKPKPAPTPAPAPPPPPPKPAAAPKPPPEAAPEKPKPGAREQEATQLVKKLLKRADTQRAGKALKTAKHLYEAILEAARKAGVIIVTGMCRAGPLETVSACTTM